MSNSKPLPLAETIANGIIKTVGDFDLSNVLLLVPTTGSGRIVKSQLTQLAHQQGKGILSPVIKTSGLLLEDIRSQYKCDAYVERLVWAEILMSLKSNLVRTLFPRFDSKSVTWSLTMAKGLLQLQKSLAEGGHFIADVKKYLPDFTEQKRWDELASIETLYYERLCKLGYRGSEEVVINYESSQFDKYNHIFICGISDLSRLIELKINQHKSLHLLNSGSGNDGDSFDDMGRPNPDQWKKKQIKLIENNIRTHYDVESMVKELVPVCRDLDSGNLAIITMDVNLTDYIVDHLREKNVPIHNPALESFRSSNVYSLLKTLFSFLQSGSYSDSISLLRKSVFSKYLYPEIGQIEILRILDIFRDNHLPYELSDAIDISRDEEVLEVFKTLSTFRDNLLQSNTLLNILEKAFDILNSSESRNPNFQFHLNEYYRHFYDLSEIPKAIIKKKNLWENTAAFLDTIESNYISPKDNVEAYTVHGWLEAFINNKDCTYILGFNEGSVPGKFEKDPFLNLNLRAALGLATPESRMARDTYLLNELINQKGQENVILSFSRISLNGEPLSPSRLLFRDEPDVIVDRCKRFFAEDENADETPLMNQIGWKFTPRIIKYEPTTISASRLKSYLNCPYRFYLENVLKYKSIDPNKAELQANEFGNLIHYSLEGLNKEAPNEEDCGEIEKYLFRKAENIAFAIYGKNKNAAIAFQLDMAKDRLKGAARIISASRKEGWFPVANELDFSSIPGFSILANGKSISISGQIDLIEKNTNTGNYRILDYKTFDKAENPRKLHLQNITANNEDHIKQYRKFSDDKDYYWADLQLPIYWHAFQQIFPTLEGESSFDPRTVEIGYFMIPRVNRDTAIMLWEMSTSEMTSAWMCIQSATEAILNGDFKPSELTLKYDNWDDCVFEKDLCHTFEMLT